MYTFRLIILHLFRGPSTTLMSPPKGSTSRKGLWSSVNSKRSNTHTVFWTGADRNHFLSHRNIKNSSRPNHQLNPEPERERLDGRWYNGNERQRSTTVLPNTVDPEFRSPSLWVDGTRSEVSSLSNRAQPARKGTGDGTRRR